ncbi:MAG TPA: hypothetical protein VE996_01115 [Terriglobales bacterium]|nr:hypothetical protein [Terriglobales bacterium]
MRKKIIVLAMSALTVGAIAMPVAQTSFGCSANGSICTDGGQCCSANCYCTSPTSDCKCAPPQQ